MVLVVSPSGVVLSIQGRSKRRVDRPFLAHISLRKGLIGPPTNQLVSCSAAANFSVPPLRSAIEGLVDGSERVCHVRTSAEDLKNAYQLQC